MFIFIWFGHGKEDDGEIWTFLLYNGTLHFATRIYMYMAPQLEVTVI